MWLDTWKSDNLWPGADADGATDAEGDLSQPALHSASKHQMRHPKGHLGQRWD